MPQIRLPDDLTLRIEKHASREARGLTNMALILLDEALRFRATPRPPKRDAVPARRSLK